MSWLKYSDSKIIFDRSLSYAQLLRPTEDEFRSYYEKPKGFWFTDESEDCWKSWCEREDWGLSGLTHKHELKLDERRFLFIETKEELLQFTNDFGYCFEWKGHSSRQTYTNWCMDWSLIASKWAGVIITPYRWDCRLEPKNSWYYGWDCASGVCWDLSAITSCQLIEVTEQKQQLLPSPMMEDI